MISSRNESRMAPASASLPASLKRRACLIRFPYRRGPASHTLIAPAIAASGQPAFGEAWCLPSRIIVPSAARPRPFRVAAPQINRAGRRAGIEDEVGKVLQFFAGLMPAAAHIGMPPADQGDDLDALLLEFLRHFNRDDVTATG